MLKKEITYEDFNGDSQTDIHYFHLSKAELVELEMTSGPDGFMESLKTIIQSNDNKQIIEEFKKIILMAYGKKSADGKSFIKSAELREDFLNTAAYSALFMELVTEDGKAAEFVNGLVPHDLAKQAAAAVQEVGLPELSATHPNGEEVSSLEDVPAWVREDRYPNPMEARTLTKEELISAYQRKSG